MKAGVRIFPDPLFARKWSYETRKRNLLIRSIPQEAVDACEKVLFKLEDGEPDVVEVFIEAGTEEELVKKIEKVEQLSPDTVRLNGRIRPFQQVIDVYL